MKSRGFWDVVAIEIVAAIILGLGAGLIIWICVVGG